MKKILLEAKDYAQICLNCPFKECEQDYWGQCSRTRPYAHKEKRRYASKEREEYES